MNHLNHLLGWSLSLCLIGCSINPTITEKPNLGQILPITATTTIKEETIKLEVAKTRQQKTLGLMYRDSLANDRGMLFTYNPPRQVNFWMKNCLISLDMIFIRNGVVRAIIPNVPPCTAEPCTTYGPSFAVDQVVELKAGRAAELELKTGDSLAIIF